MLRKVIIHKSLYSPLLFVGCERLVFTAIVTLGGVIIMAYQSILILGCVLAFYLLSIILVRRINEEDPQFFKCLYRYVRYYQDYYPANEFYPGKSDISYSHFE